MDGSKIGTFVITIASLMILFIVNTCVNDFCDTLSHMLNCSVTGSESLSPGFLLFFTDLLFVKGIKRKCTLCVNAFHFTKRGILSLSVKSALKKETYTCT